MKRIVLVAFVALTLLLASPNVALAYVGPGLGTGAVVAVLGILAAILLLILGVVYYPLKRLIKTLRTKKQGD